MSSVLNDLEVRLTEMKLTGQKREDRIFVGNLAPQMTEEEIRALFNPAVYKIAEVRIITESDRGLGPSTKTPRRYAFVTFERKEDVTTALKELQGQQVTVHGRKLVFAEAYKMAPHTRPSLSGLPFLNGGLNPYLRWAQVAGMPRTMGGFPGFQYPMTFPDNLTAMAMGFPIVNSMSPFANAPLSPSSVPTSPNPHGHQHHVPATSRINGFSDGYLASAGIIPTSSSLLDFSPVSHLNSQSVGNSGVVAGVKYPETSRVSAGPSSYANYILHNGHQTSSHNANECSGCIHPPIPEENVRFQAHSVHAAPAYWKQTHASIS